MPINELRAITTFVRTVELGSLSQAAAAQQITPQAASKALTQLEQHLGVRLFHRTTRRMALTEEGRRFLDSVQPALTGLQQALQGARQSREAMGGPLRIVGPRTVLPQVLGPLLDEYCRLYPEVEPDVLLDDRIGHWVEDRVDVGFRLGNSPEEGVIARRLFPMQLVVCAAPTYLRRHGVPRSLADLASHRCSAFRRLSGGGVVPWRVHVGDCTQDLPVRPAFCTNDEAFELRAVLAGDVLAQLAMPTAAPHIRSGRLVPLLVEHLCDTFSMHLYYGSRVAQPARVRCFIDLAVERLTDSSALVLDTETLMTAHERGLAALAMH